MYIQSIKRDICPLIHTPSPAEFGNLNNLHCYIISPAPVRTGGLFQGSLVFELVSAIDNDPLTGSSHKCNPTRAGSNCFVVSRTSMCTTFYGKPHLQHVRSSQLCEIVRNGVSADDRHCRSEPNVETNNVEVV